MEVIYRSDFRKATIETVRFERGSHLELLESECFAGCSLPPIPLPVPLGALPSSCFMGANAEEVTFRTALFCAELKQNVSVGVT
jgi:hypothetical protein